MQTAVSCAKVPHFYSLWFLKSHIKLHWEFLNKAGALSGCNESTSISIQVETESSVAKAGAIYGLVLYGFSYSPGQQKQTLSLRLTTNPAHLDWQTITSTTALTHDFNPL